MFFRLLFESFRRQKRRKSVAFLAIALGMSIATAMIAVAAGIGDKISQELRSTGANLVITPIEDTLDVNLGGVDLKPASEGAYIAESDLPKLKGIFWGHNIVGFAPFLGEQKTFTKNGKNFQAELIGTYFDQTVRYGKETVTTGVRSVNRWWQVEGDWPQDYEDWPNHAQAAGERRCDADVPRELPCRLEFSLRSSDAAPGVLAGRGLAASAGLHIGDLVTVADRQLRISGILNSGGGEDQAIVAPLHIVQQLLRRPNAVRRVIVSALTKPEDAFGRRDPSKMTPAQRQLHRFSNQRGSAQRACGASPPGGTKPGQSIVARLRADAAAHAGGIAGFSARSLGGDGCYYPGTPPGSGIDEVAGGLQHF